MVLVRVQRIFTCIFEGCVMFDILVNNGFFFEYYATIEADSVFDARTKWKQRADWTTESFKVRRVKK